MCVLTDGQTTELTRLQVGEDPSTPANIIVSTIIEAEKIAPLLQEFQSKGRKVNVSVSLDLAIGTHTLTS